MFFSDPDVSPRLGQEPDAPAVLEVVQIWNGTVLAVHHLVSGGEALTVGGLRSTFVAASGDLSASPRVLFSSGGSGFQVHTATGWTGSVATRASGDPTPLEAVEGDGSVAISDGATVCIDVGDTRFVARLVPPGKVVPGAHKERLDSALLSSVSLASLLGGLLAVLVALAPPPAQATLAEIPDRFASVVLQSPKPPPVRDVPPVREPAASAGADASASGSASDGGNPGTSRPLAGRVAGESALRTRDQSRARSAGLLGALSADPSLKGLLGGSVVTAGMVDGLGSALASKGASMGTLGLGNTGRTMGGAGGPGRLGGAGTRGRHAGQDTYGKEGGDLGPREPGGSLALPQDAITLGALDKSLIDGVIKQHLNAVRYCYQRQLAQDPTLEGKVVLKFVVAGDGTVSKAQVKRSSLGSAKTESCMVSQFYKMRFPAPKGGGIVIVSYPFFFQAD